MLIISIPRILVLTTILCSLCASVSAQKINYEYRPSPIDNPVRGLVPYASAMPWFDPNSSADQKAAYLEDYRKRIFPHSIEFHYFSMRDLLPAARKVDFSPIEKLLEQTTSRGCQLTFRVFLEYPDHGIAVPQFLIDNGLKITKWKNEDAQTIHAPDYGSLELRDSIDFLIAKLGKKYDGDPRVACLTLGILGHWGEWHSYPRSELFPKKDYQTHLMDQFETAFKKTPVLMRYPAGKDDWSYAANFDRSFGYHDDSFAWATRATGKKDDDWFFLAKINSSGASNAWKTRMIGGEIRPEIWGCVFDDDSCEVKGQEFDACVDESHVTWLMDSGMFDEDAPPSEKRIKNATKSIGRMGYEFFVSRCDIDVAALKTSISISIENRGVAPFYSNWPVEIAILNSDGKVIESKTEDWKISSLLPGSGASKKVVSFSRSMNSGHQLAMRIKNPMPEGFPIRFANTTQSLDGECWLILR